MVSHKTLIIYFFIWRNSGIVIMGRMEKTYIRKREKKYAIYSLFDKKRLTKYYDNIEELEENVYIAKDEKTEKYAFLSSGFSTKTEYKEIHKVLDTEINEYLYIGIVEEERIDILTKIDKINIKELSQQEQNKLINLLLEIKNRKSNFLE